MPGSVNQQKLATQFLANRSAIQKLQTELEQFASSHDAWSDYFMKDLTFSKVLDSMGHVLAEMLSNENEQAINIPGISMGDALSWKERLDSQSAAIVKMQGCFKWWQQQSPGRAGN